jgi:hypothetical protein
MAIVWRTVWRREELALALDTFAVQAVLRERERCLIILKRWGADDNDYSHRFPETKLAFDRVSKSIASGETP